MLYVGMALSLLATALYIRRGLAEARGRRGPDEVRIGENAVQPGIREEL
jgi:hypothetical protein